MTDRRGRSGPEDVLYGEPVRRIFAPQVSNWHVLDNRRLLLYASRSRPYLLTLSHPAHGLRTSSTIGLRRRGTSIDARFDDVIVDGFNYRIERIEKLDVNVAKRLRGIEVVQEDEDKEETPSSDEDEG